MCHVLIIEDDMIASLDIRDTIRGAGATSFSFATTEREAVDAARESKPAVIISDIMLASGFGHLAVRAIQAEHGFVPVIFITATPDQCEGCEAYTVLDKPFSETELATSFRSVAPG